MKQPLLTLKPNWVLALSLMMVLAITGMAAEQPAEAPESAQPQEIVHDDLVMFGQDIVLKKNEVAKQVVVVGGNAQIDGKVKQDVVVVMGSATVNGTINGSLVVVMGPAEIGPTARVRQEAVVVGGRLKVDPSARLGRGHKVISIFGLPGVGHMREWMGKGLFLARPLPPLSIWMWSIAGLFLLLYFLVALIFPRPVQACVTALEMRPISSFSLGVLAFVLAAPAAFLLVISLVGIVVLPFLFCAIVAALCFGKVAVFRHVGQQIGCHLRLSVLQAPLMALLIGALLFYLLYTIPILGFLVWCIITPLGLGAVIWACLQRFQREDARPAAPAGTATFPIPPQLAPPVQVNLPANEAIDWPRAGFWIRLCATVLDLMLLVALLAVLHLLRGPGFFFLVLISYHVAMWAWKGMTIGGIVLSVRCVRLDGRRVNVAVALVRALACFLSGLPLFLGFFWAGWTREKQSWHDRIAGTTMVKVPKGGASLL